MRIGAAVMPGLLAVRPVNFRPSPYDWVPLVVIILLIVVFVSVYSKGGRSRGPAGHHDSHVPDRSGAHGHGAKSKRRPKQP